MADRVRFVRGDAARVDVGPGAYDVVSCIGATWIGGGPGGTIELMRPALRPGGLMLVGEPYWTEEPPPEAYPALGIGRDECASLVGTLDRFEAAGMRVLLDAGRRPHLAYGRRHLGWAPSCCSRRSPAPGPHRNGYDTPFLAILVSAPGFLIIIPRRRRADLWNGLRGV